jgi:outer membrane lipoprotein-sorting protein
MSAQPPPSFCGITTSSNSPHPWYAFCTFASMRSLWPLFLSGLVLSQVDPRADNLIKRSRKKLHSLESFVVQFAYQVENKADTTQKRIAKSGTLRYRPRQNKFAVDMNDMLIVCDGKTLWQYLKKENEVTITTYNPKEGFSLDRIFRIYDMDMKVRLDKSDTYKGQTIHKISLFPISDTTDYFRVEVWINEATELPQRIRFSHRDGTVVEYELKNFQVMALPDTEFVFDSRKYPGISVVDLR